MEKKVLEGSDLEVSVSRPIEKRGLEEVNQEDVAPKNIIDKLGLRFNAEIRGVERVPEDQRSKGSMLTPFFIYASPNLAIAALSTGALGTASFGLDFWTCTIVIIIWSFIGALPVGLFAVFGMKFGLRQQILSRYFTGNIMGRVFALFNVISCIGWNAINIIPSVELLAQLGPLPPWAGCLIFVVITCVIAMWGYKYIHLYERYSGIPNFIIYLVIIARLTMSKNFTFGTMGKGTAEAGNVLTFIALIFGFVAGWCPSAADFMVYLPSNTKSWKVFWPMVFGLSLPSMFALILGAACGSATATDPDWADAFESDSIGGLVYAILVPNSLHGFGKFCCVILALSGVANNLPGSYSLSLAIQAVWSPLAKFPRIGWCFVGNFLSLALSIPAYYKFSATMSNFLSIIGYNVSIYIGISLSEILVIRRSWSAYDFSNFDDGSTVPIGIAGVFTFCCGVATTVLSMNQTWYSGVISQKFGEYGGEVSFELNIVACFIIYSIVRPIEKKYFKR
ncbi:purine-cytosine permease Fcy2p [[Candida] railenensis]|uniref:Purine-cytosine permease Fcy2p n=1 Tax=[Candida] railenensis TaxID=45579 RepID=A0A9P0QSA5_9ASCO|nr:purine-cytosine permease Fcy2p [[Candida] railenensis]